MFKFIHAADLHLDSPLRGLQKYEGAPVELLRSATRRALENLVELALEESVSFVLIAGDIYDGNWKDYSTGLFFHKQMARLQRRDIPVYIIKGNHDAESVITMALQLPANVKDFSTAVVESRQVGELPVTIHGRGFPNQACPDNMAVTYPTAVPGHYNIGLLHTSLTGYEGHGNYAPCSETDLIDKGYHYWALGHIHQPDVINTNPHIVFSGNIQGRHARETGPRGCQLVEVNNEMDTTTHFQVLDEVRWDRQIIDVSSASSESDLYDLVRNAIQSAITEASPRLVALRIELLGTTELHSTLHLKLEEVEANIRAQAQIVGIDAAWIEKIKISTSPLVDTATLAERDDLTRSLLEKLERDNCNFPEPDDLPAMLRILPMHIKSEIETEILGGQQGDLVQDVQALILATLESSAETTS